MSWHPWDDPQSRESHRGCTIDSRCDPRSTAAPASPARGHQAFHIETHARRQRSVAGTFSCRHANFPWELADDSELSLLTLAVQNRRWFLLNRDREGSRVATEFFNKLVGRRAFQHTSRKPVAFRRNP